MILESLLAQGEYMRGCDVCAKANVLRVAELVTTPLGTVDLCEKHRNELEIKVVDLYSWWLSYADWDAPSTNRICSGPSDPRK